MEKNEKFPFSLDVFPNISSSNKAIDSVLIPLDLSVFVL